MILRLWAKPAFLWTMSVIVPLAVIPVVWLEEQILALEHAVPIPDTGDDWSILVTVLIWFGAPIASAAICLTGYRGGATMLPLFGRGVVSALIAIASFGLSAVFVLAGLVGTEFPALHGWPLAGWFIVAAVYLQALRAAAVRRSLPHEQDALIRVFE